MNDREEQVSLFSIGNLLFTLFVGLPLFAYIAGSILYPYFDLEGFNVIPFLSIFPTFPEFYELTMATFGTEAGKRFFVIAMFLIVIFSVQMVMTLYFAFAQGADPEKPVFIPDVKDVFCLIIALAAFYATFFMPDFTMHLTSRNAPAFYHTDLKFFVFVSMFWVFNCALFVALSLLFRMVFSIIRKVREWGWGG